MNIVKVQVSIVTMEEHPQILVYNSDRSIYYQEAVTKDVKELMNGELKKYFYYDMVGTQIRLLDEVTDELLINF